MNRIVWLFGYLGLLLLVFKTPEADCDHTIKVFSYCSAIGHTLVFLGFVINFIHRNCCYDSGYFGDNSPSPLYDPVNPVNITNHMYVPTNDERLTQEIVYHNMNGVQNSQ